MRRRKSKAGGGEKGAGRRVVVSGVAGMDLPELSPRGGKKSRKKGEKRAKKRSTAAEGDILLSVVEADSAGPASDPLADVMRRIAGGGGAVAAAPAAREADTATGGADDGLWDPTVVFAPGDVDVSRTARRSLDDDRTLELMRGLSPASELQRHRCVQGLRERLAAAAEKDSLKVSNQIFERWQACRSLDGAGAGQPMLPAGTNPALDAGFAAELREAGAPAARAAEIVDTVVRHSTKAARTLTRAYGGGPVPTARLVLATARKVACERSRWRIKGGKHNDDDDGDGDGDDDGDGEFRLVYNLKFGTMPQPVNDGHYEKLRRLYAENSPRGLAGEAAFHQALYLLLLRYATMSGTFTQGAGFHGALPGEVFDVLRRRFDVRMECFASPLNCRYRRFCSAFPDTDCVFGSVGSFFDFWPAEGSYEANPPFVDEVMAAMMCHVDELMEAAGARPLMFVVFVPAWKDKRGWQVIRESRHTAHHELIEQSDHGYTEGAQHIREGRWRIATQHTSVFFVQNDAARRKWPASAEVMTELRAAFVSRHAGEERAERKREEVKKGGGSRPARPARPAGERRPFAFDDEGSSSSEDEAQVRLVEEKRRKKKKKSMMMTKRKARDEAGRDAAHHKRRRSGSNNTAGGKRNR